jgi:hypothetical protein
MKNIYLALKNIVSRRNNHEDFDYKELRKKFPHLSDYEFYKYSRVSESDLFFLIFEI